MKKPQWITVLAGIILVIAIYSFGRTVPEKKSVAAVDNHQHSEGDGHNHGPDDGHDHGPAAADITIDTILAIVKKQLSNEQVMRLTMLENSITRGDVKQQQLKVYHELSHFWGDSARIFEPYAWYEAEAARLENSEKTLTFAAHLFLDNLQQSDNPALTKWKALQAKDLFERSLKINPDNDSSKVGLGACYLFGNISDAPMQGISMIREVADRDSTNLYAQITLVRGSLLSGQYDKAITRLLTINRVQPGYPGAALLLADVYDRTGDKANAITWYETSLRYASHPEQQKEIEKRIKELKK